MLHKFILSESPKKIPELYHLSFDFNLEGLWDPRVPAGSDLGAKTSTSEPDFPRISCSPTIEDCFRAIYPNVSKYFEEENFPHMEFCVYSPELDPSSVRVLTPDDLRRLRYVHDAHLTQEHCILDPVRMRRVMAVEVLNTNGSEFLTHRPFGDRRYRERGFAPKDVTYRVTRRFR